MPHVAMMDLASMKPEEARVLVAQDALELLDESCVTPSRGSYLEAYNRTSHYEYNTPAEVVYDEMSEGCNVCALGIALVAAVRRFNKVSFGALGGSVGPSRVHIIPYLLQFFDIRQLDLMETVFEGHEIGGAGKLTDSDMRAAIKYRRTLISDAEEFDDSEVDDAYAMRGILRNIIDNNGTFVVPGLEGGQP